jgi:hypothetical protein
MNLKFNMKDINKILAKSHFKCKKPQIDTKKHVSMNLLEVSLSCLHFSLVFSKSPCEFCYLAVMTEKFLLFLNPVFLFTYSLF